MARGGKREGAGRKAGGKNRRTMTAAELRDRLMEEGETPLEVLTEYMRRGKFSTDKLMEQLEGDALARLADAPAEKIEALTALVKETRALVSVTKDCAKEAAPYFHPRLAAIEHSGEMTVSWEDAIEQARERRRQREQQASGDAGK
jgi:hypothetical protein